MLLHPLPAAYHTLLAAHTDAVLLETSAPTATERYSYLFLKPVAVLQTMRAAAFPALLAELQQWVDRSYFVAGYAGYEAGYAWTKWAADYVAPPGPPLVWFGVYAQPLVFDHLTGASDVSATEAEHPPQRQTSSAKPFPDLAFDVSMEEYGEHIKRIKAHIAAGDCYQINFTGRYRWRATDAPLDHYQALATNQPVHYAAVVRVPGYEVRSFSPELFFQIEHQQITTRPMKGTAPRGRSRAEDAAHAAWLHADAKNRAENLMIVDLLRNDLGRISEIGSVRVPELWAVEQYRTVLQMTSTVTATLRPATDIATIFHSLFPCGSVTGAPKLRAMEIIRTLEAGPRGVYCGAIGYIAPPTNVIGQRRRACFSVAIRTLVMGNGVGEMGSGSGIVWEAEAAAEYAECLLKAQFLTTPPIQFEIIESLRWHDGFPHLSAHLHRMANSARYWDYPFDQAAAAEELQRIAASCTPGVPHKARLLLDRWGKLRGEAAPIIAEPWPHRVALCTTATSPADRWLYHKTTHRPLYDQARRSAAEHGLVDLLFVNERGELTEGASNNLFILRDGELLTPTLDCGVLPGIARADALRTQPPAREAILHPADLATAEQIFLCNSVRGCREVTLAPDSIVL